MQVGDVCATRAGITKFAAGTGIVAPGRTPMIIQAAAGQCVVPIPSAEIGSGGVVVGYSIHAVLAAATCYSTVDGSADHVNVVTTAQEAVTILTLAAFIIFAARTVSV